jgi:hypothetical protein
MLQTLGKKKGSPTACWLKKLGLLHPSPNPPNQNRIPASLEYLRRLEVDSAYVTPQGLTESPTTYRRRMYDLMVTILQAEATTKGMRVEKLWPGTNWDRVWTNLWAAPVPDSIKDTRYRVIHDILPTRKRLHTIRIAATDFCSTCNEKDTIQHRIIEYGEGRVKWTWTRGRLAVMLRKDPLWLLDDWIYPPQLQI